jgi:hypothetical protein
MNSTPTSGYLCSIEWRLEPGGHSVVGGHRSCIARRLQTYCAVRHRVAGECLEQPEPVWAA